MAAHVMTTDDIIVHAMTVHGMTVHDITMHDKAVGANTGMRGHDKAAEPRSIFGTEVACRCLASWSRLGKADGGPEQH
eukprot:1161023-Pelagomonas_calceolata.AAC.2